MKSLYVWGLAAPGSEGSVDGASPRGFLRFFLKVLKFDSLKGRCPLSEAMQPFYTTCGGAAPLFL